MVNLELEKEIKDYLVSADGKIIAARALPNVLRKRGYYEYLMERYTDNTTNEFAEILYRFVNNIETVPICPECGNPIKFSMSSRMYPHWCSAKCRNNSEEVKKKNKDNVSKALKDVYANRKDIILEKRAKTLSDRYGENNTSGSPFSNIGIREKAKEKILEKYGVENVFSLDEYRKSEDIKSRMRKDSVELWRTRGLNIEYTDNETIIIHNGCEKHGDIELSIGDFNNRTKSERMKTSTICPICHPINYYSGEENALKEFLDKNGIRYITNTRSIIKPYELDFYISDRKLAIEMNGVYYHSLDSGKNRNYHKRKTELCEKENIQLIHIWEDEWCMKRDIILSMLKSKLGILDNKIYARKCVVKEISAKTARIFCEKNHLQGYVNSKYRYGLFHENELVSVMTFGNCRSVLNMGKEEKSCELYRFCNKLNTSIIGGASKLFKYAEEELKKFGYNTIYTFAQRDWSNGNLYDRLGFEKIGETEPNYFYCGVGKERISRYSCMKHKLVGKYGDNGLTENDMMNMRGYYRCYDSGNLKYKKSINNERE